MTHVVFRRGPRLAAPPIPRGELALQSPPGLPEVTPAGMSGMLMMVPMAAGSAGSMLMFAQPGAKPATYLGSGMMALSMSGMALSQVGRGAAARKHKVNGARRDYLRYLSQVRERIRKAAAAQREALGWALPHPDALWSFAMSARLWERRPADADFGDIRIAIGAQRPSVTLTPPETKPVEDLEPLCVGALRRFLRVHSTVPDLPVALSARAFAHIALEGGQDAADGDGDAAARLDLARAMVAHLAVMHSPDDLRIAVCAPPERAADWEWVKWLPHAQHPTQRDAAGPVRLVADTLSGVEDLLAGDLTERPRFHHRADPLLDEPHLVVILDHPRTAAESVLANPGRMGVTLIDLSGTPTATAQDGALRLRVTAQALQAVGVDQKGRQALSAIGRPDRLGLAQAAALARQLARYRPGSGEEGQHLDATLDLTGLLGVGDAERFDPAAHWPRKQPWERLRVPVGITAQGTPVELDIKESAQGGFGPHGLLIGATGSGKSELLRTIVLSLAMTHSSEVLNFVLVDFKGGATFAGLADLPHNSALITNLSDELALVDRMKDALHGELIRRQELLRAAGNHASLRDYDRAREQGAALPPVPSLFIVVDEFTELLTSKPDFIELFVMIGRLGRSLGVHLLLASQRLEEGRLRGLETHLSYRIGLRTFSALESRLVLGVSDAHDLPSAPGNGFLKTDTTTLTRFKGAYVSGPYQHAGRSRHDRPVQRQALVAFGSGYLAPRYLPEPEPVTGHPGGGSGEGSGQTLMDVLIGRLKGAGPPAHQVWLAPLAEPPSLDELLPPLAADPGTGFGVQDPDRRGRLQVPLGLVDRPFEQCWDLLWADLSGAAGHVGVAGGTQSGKSTLLRTLVAGLALSHTPRQVQFYCLDFGGGALAALAGLPHVGSVASRLQPDLVGRTVAELITLLREREQHFQAHGIDSMASYRRMREEGHFAGDTHGDVFLVVDGWLTLRQDYEQHEAAVTALAARGLAYGIHVVVSAARWSDIRPALRDLLGSRFELRLGDPMESMVDRRSAANVPAGCPGRGITGERLHLLTALPRIDGGHGTEDLAEASRALAATVAEEWPGQPAPRIRMLPEVLQQADLPEPAAGGIPIGLSEAALRPVYLDFGQDPHLIVIGDTGSGKTNLLRLLADGIVRTRTPEQALFVLVDYRRSLAGAVPADHILGYAPSSAVLLPMMQEVAAALTERLPGPEATAGPQQGASWSGPELYVVVDDYDLVASRDNPLSALLDLLPQAADIGLHLVIARRSGGAGRAMYEAVPQRLKELGAPGLLLSCERDEGVIFGSVKPVTLPPGRGHLVTRRRGAELLQLAVLS
jgi:DNA segregation ATPase FtsK/SpoIIIE, S-DNA-T family